ncbi:hypothetical protein A2U01_0091755, partial [Trifolium medium]|nr:hypothetical protein [Trifolium medium]
AGGTGALRRSVHKQQESCLEGARCAGSHGATRYGNFKSGRA